MKRIAFTVSFELPIGATSEDAFNYVCDAVCSMKGCYRPPGANSDDDPGDPMFSMDVDTVRIKRGGR